MNCKNSLFSDTARAAQRKKVKIFFCGSTAHLANGQYRIREYRCCYRFCCRDAMHCVSTGNAMWDFFHPCGGWCIGK